MNNKQKKYLIPSEEDCTHIGNLIHWEITQQKVKKQDIASKLSIKPISLTAYFKQASVHTIILWRIGKIINYNFFMFLGERMNIPYETKTEKSLKEQLLQKEKELYDLQKEKELLMKVLGK